MVSLRTKIAVLITIALVTLTCITGGYVTTKTRSVVLNDAEILMKTVSKEQVSRLNNQLESIERATKAIHSVVENGLNVRDHLSTPNAVASFLNSLEKTALDIAKNVDGMQGMYVRFAPDVGSGYDGFFYVRKRDKLVWEPLTDISKYAKDDVEHVGWFWGAAKSRNPVWLAPYKNENIGIAMFSYVIPIFHNDKFVGVVGADVGLEQFSNTANINSVYKNADGHLITLDYGTTADSEDFECIDSNEIVCKERNASDPLITNFVKHHIPKHFYTRVNDEFSSGDALETIKIDGQENKLAFRTLQNGMKYVVHVPSVYIYEEADNLIFAIVLMTIGTLVIFNIITINMSKRFIVPLEKLNKATHEIANGNWSADITCNSNDEIGELAKSIAVMKEKLKTHVTEVKNLAYKDALTNVKNKTAYNEYIEKIKLEKWRDYAVMMFDVNYLKMLNDTYGHEQGDALIKCASNHICRIYDHSPVFRTGGDEFVAILSGEDYDNRFVLKERFKEEMLQERIKIEPYTELSIACGMADWNEANSYDEVYHMADKEMYKDKIAMKKKIGSMDYKDDRL